MSSSSLHPRSIKMGPSDRTTAPLLEYADELVEKLRDLLPKAVNDHDETAIHHARVSTRRLKAAMDVFEPIASRSHRKDFLKVLRKLRKHLGPARDLDVMIGHVGEIKIDRMKPGLDWLVQNLTQQRDALRHCEEESFDVAKALARLGAWWGVRQDWAEAGDGLHCLIGESLHLQLDRFVEYANAITNPAIIQSDKQTIDPHQLRIAGKALRYTLDLATAAGHRIPASVGKAFKRMQDALGEWHDYVVLCDCVLQLSVDCQIAHTNSIIATSLLEVAKFSVQRADTRLLRFKNLWTDRGNALATTIRTAFPLTEAVSAEAISESKTDPDLPGSETPPLDQPATAPGETSAA